MKTLFTLLLSCCSFFVSGQTGNYFLSHYSPGEERFDHVCFDMVQDKKGVMYFATKAGILEFDGRNWDLLPGRSAIYSLQINSSGEIYWAGAKGFGKVGLDSHGFQQIVQLSDSSVVNVFQSLIVKDDVYFLTEDAIFVVDQKENKSTVIKSESKEDTLLKLFELFGVVYVSTDNGTYQIDRDKLSTASLKINHEVIFSARIDNNYIIATGNNKVYTCNEDLILKPVLLQDSAYIDASVIVNGSWLNRQMLVLGTLRGGVVFINPINGVTQEIINYSTGLPDNEVFQLMTDANENVWVAHDYGFTKIAPYMPLSSFSHYAGLQGNLLCAFSSHNTVYVGTSLGLFKLEKLDVYDEITYYIDVEVKQSGKKSQKTPSAAPTVIPEQKQEAEAKTQSKKGGFLRFLRNKKAETEPGNNEPVSSAIASDERPSDNGKSKPLYKQVKKSEKVLRSSQYIFKKTSGIDAKITHLAEVQGKLLASGLGGLYEVNNLQAKVLLEEPIRYMYAPSKSDIVIVSTYSDEVRTLRLAGKTVENSSLFSNLSDQIHYIFQGNNELWFCGIDKLYRAEINGSDIRHKQTIELVHRNTDKTVGAVLNNEVILVNADGFYHFVRSKSTIEKMDTLPNPSQYFAHNGGIVYRDQHGWNFLGADENKTNLQLLNVFQDLRFIASDKDTRHLWLISGGNELYKFLGDKSISLENEFPLFLKAIVNQDRKVIRLKEILIDQEHSSLKFEVVQPDYINPESVEFRYLLTGMQNTWSEWSNNSNIISFPFLPTGEYTLQVQARNIFGKVSELQPLSFEVLPPYWKRSWFYALEFAIFASLVMLSFRLSTRYRIVSRLLSLLTIILLIEFIQTAIGATILTEDSPVVDFFIQVVVAFLVLPVEGYLRNLMLRSLDSSGKFYQFIVPGSPLKPKQKPEIFIKEVSDIDK